MKKNEKTYTVGFDNKPVTFQEVIDAAIAGTLASAKNRHPQTILNLADQPKIA